MTLVTSIAALRHRHKGAAVWVLGSGKSLDFLPKTFFDDKIVVGVNATYRDWPVTYAFAHHRKDAQEALDAKHVVVASEYDEGRRENGKNALHGGTWFQYRHPQQPPTLVMDMTPMQQDDDGALVIGSNTVTSALDFAGRILGATTVVMCGVDGGAINGRWNYDRYNAPSSTDPSMRMPCHYCGCVHEGLCDGGKDTNWLEQQTRGGTGLPHIKAQSSLIAQVIRGLTLRGIAVMSMRLEGHTFER